MCQPNGTPKCEKGRDPAECSPEQIRECHGDAPVHECETTGCEQAQNPADCSDEQIRECHGEAAAHPCEQT